MSPDLGLLFHSLSQGLVGPAQVVLACVDHGIRELHRDEGARPACGEPGVDSAEPAYLELLADVKF